jgi:Ig-like domain-containing protein
MLSSRARTPILVVLIIITLACAPALVLPGTEPTPAPVDINVVIAQTAAMAASQTAIALPATQTPTITVIPTSTASLTPSATNTFVFLLNTATNLPTVPADEISNPNKNFACTIASVYPDVGTVFAPNGLFVAQWVVKNTGASNWDSNNVDLIYVKGDQLHLEGGSDLPKSAAPGDTITLSVNMKAPDTPGNYSTTWNLRSNNLYFCSLKISIVVQ